ncbi:hypothetical protein ACFPOC_11605 [Rubellimicrobium aerolatum]|uniref:LysR family transcriptional regulator n=1 Tax=Rubellimicrobium aerolatum TaxID=490979 RepID=A0ABW0SDN2_9RHOB
MGPTAHLAIPPLHDIRSKPSPVTLFLHNPASQAHLEAFKDWLLA